jgi:tetratricopeptide (TPR) repeat protein
LVWYMLAQTVGTHRFSRFLQAYAKEHAYDRVKADDFLVALRIAAEEKSWFIDQWFRRTGAPDLKMSWKRESAGVKVAVEQSLDNTYQLILPLRIIGPAGHTVVMNVNIAGPLTEVSIPTDFAVNEVVLDPEFKVLRWTPEYRAEAEAIIDFTRGDIALNRGNSDEAIAVFRRALSTVTSDDEYGLRFKLHRGLGDALAASDQIVPARDAYLAALSVPVHPEEQVPELLFSLSELYRKLGDAGAERDAQARAIACINAMSVSGRDGRVSAGLLRRSPIVRVREDCR